MNYKEKQEIIENLKDVINKIKKQANLRVLKNDDIIIGDKDQLNEEKCIDVFIHRSGKHQTLIKRIFIVTKKGKIKEIYPKTTITITFDDGVFYSSQYVQIGEPIHKSIPKNAEYVIITLLEIEDYEKFHEENTMYIIKL
jgi:predicted amidohydrolase